MLEARSEPQKINFRVWLQQEFTTRARKNSQFSLRAFARLLGMDASTISQILAGKRNPTNRVIEKICDQLSCSPATKLCFMKTVRRSRKTLQPAEPLPDYHQLAIDSFAVIADWYHYAILELTFAEGFRDSPKWIAKKLDISPTEASVAIDRLERLKLLERKNGKLGKAELFTTNGTEGFTAPALKEFQRQIIQKALEAIEHAKPEEKDITSMTMAIDPTKLDEARKRIRNFRRELCVFLEQGKRTRVYNLGVQLYPISESTITNDEGKK